MIHCPCGSSESYMDCCGHFIEVDMVPQTPEELMRSRYTAYTQANIPYIIKTMRGKAAKGFDPVEAYQWASSVHWDGLEVLRTYLKGKNVGFVEFIATFRSGLHVQRMRELSEFHRHEGKWYYMNGSK